MIAILDYGMGNVTSVRNAFARLGFATVLTGDPAVLDSCRSIILPGVGAFGSAVEELRSKGLFAYLHERREKGCYLLGICLGQQLFFGSSAENPESAGLAYFKDTVRRFPQVAKVPHMGWNRVYCTDGDVPLFQGIPQGTSFYFAHSYYVPLNRDYLLASCRHTVDFAAAVKEGNTYGLQFHPEKSGEWGLQLLANFGRMVEDADHSGY